MTADAMSTTTAPPVVRSRPMTNAELAASFGPGSESLRAALAAHLEHFGTLIPHMYMDGVVAHLRSVVAAVVTGRAPRAARRAEIAAILGALEAGMEAGGRETRNVISISFVKTVESEEFFGELVELLGPRLRGHLLPR